MERAPREQPWVHPAVAVSRSGIEGKGLFATEDIAVGTVVIRLGGRLVTTGELGRLIAAAEAEPELPYVDSVTVYEDAHLVLPPGTMVHFGNHSCDPNLWHAGPYEVAARRQIRAGEELTIDYGASSGAPGFTLTCLCGSALCRGQVTSDDWRRPELQRAYAGHWAPALAERISRRGDDP